MSKILLAVSGGVDSMVMLDMYKNKDIGVIHINHKTRGIENTKEANLIKEECEKINASFHYFEYENKYGNFHNEARKFRISKYQETIQRYNYEKFFLAHHKDDQLENILMYKEKIGSKLMKKIQKIENFVIERPLLEIEKKKIYEYAFKKEIKFLEDSSNLKLKYKRNIVRSSLKNYTEIEKNKLYKSELLREEKIFNRYNEFIRIEKKRDFNIYDFKNEIDIYIFLKLKDITKNISKKRLIYLKNQIKSGKNVKIELCEKIQLFINYSKVYVVNYNLSNKFVSSMKISGIDIKIEFNNIIVKPKSRNIKTFEPGDRINKKKVNRIFIDEKIPINLRPIWPIFTNENKEIIYIPKMNEVKLNEKLGWYNLYE